LIGMQLISRLNQAFDTRLEMRDLFDAFTIADMAVFIENEQKPLQQNKPQAEHAPGPESERIDSMNEQQLLASIDQLSEEQVALLLARMQEEV